jgi:hypothetical protein
MDHAAPHSVPRAAGADHQRRTHARDAHGSDAPPRLTPGLILDGLPPARVRVLQERTYEERLTSSEGPARILLRLLTAAELVMLARRIDLRHEPTDEGALELYRKLSALC